MTTTCALRVWVSKGGRCWDEVYNDIMPLDDQSKGEKRHLNTVREIFEAEGYTYVVLGLGRLRRGKWESTNLNPHVTIAYAAAMDDSQQKALREILEAQILGWCRLQPHKRLANLTRFRRFETQTRQEKAGSTRLTRDSTRKPIALMQPTDVSDMLAEDRIHTLDVDELDDLREFVWRLYDRDRDRLSEGRKRAEHLRANEGTLEIFAPSRALAANRWSWPTCSATCPTVCATSQAPASGWIRSQDRDRESLFRPMWSRHIGGTSRNINRNEGAGGVRRG